MKNNSSRRLVIIGILLLSTTALLLAVALNSFYSENVAQDEKNSQKTAKDYNPYEKSNGKDKQKIISAPPPAAGSGSVEINNDFKEGIPTGTYSHPPKTIRSSGSSSLSPGSPLQDNNSSVERNKSIEENMAAENAQSTIPNYSQPSSSNNFNSSSNSLISPLENSASGSSLTSPLGDSPSVEIPSSQEKSKSNTITPSPLGQSSSGLSRSR
ncbi:hypothetical protein [Pleurocapsa sp. FMAR1]|uniref:hypothetical protein n=1 Tax=Pleurocapsa sp. FMAR1 TaxID=3040204 RepID=UPI0029C78000|nr:hypothetical protein [Pleurocapsa sp. FMAR1]